MGKHAAPEQPSTTASAVVWMNGTTWCVVRDKRHIYIRNYMPHLRPIHQLHVRHAHHTHRRRPVSRRQTQHRPGRFWKPNRRELYDLQYDPDEVNNLAGSKKHAAIPATHCATGQGRSYSGYRLFARRRTTAAPAIVPRTTWAIILSSTLWNPSWPPPNKPSLKPEDTPALIKLLSHQDSAVRYWAAMGLLMWRKGRGSGAGRITQSVSDKSTAVARTAPRPWTLWQGQGRGAGRGNADPIRRRIEERYSQQCWP